jgi:hypothetical protein
MNYGGYKEMIGNRFSIAKAIVIVSISIFVAAGLAAEELQGTVQTSIAPLSIPAYSTAILGQVGMLLIEFKVKPPDEGTIDITSVDLTLTGTIDPDDIDGVYVYFEEQDGGTTNDGVFDVDVDKQVKTATFGGSNTITLDNWKDADSNPVTLTVGRANWPTTMGFAYMYIALDFASDVASNVTVGCTVSTIVNTGTVSPVNPAVNATTVNMDNYAVALTGDTSGLSLTTGAPGAPVTALELDFDIADSSLFSAPTTGGYAAVDRIRIHNTGTAAGSDFNSLVVFRDDIANGLYDDPGDTRFGTGTMSGGYATIDLTTPIQIYTGNDVYYIAVNLSSGAVAGRTVGLQVEDPSDTTNARFLDILTDTNVAAQYGQVGYISGPSLPSEPAIPDTFTIIPPDDGNPPSVIFSSPSDSALNVNPENPLIFIFSEAIDESTLDTDPAGGYADFSLSDKETVPNDYETTGILSYNAETKTLRWTPTTPLPWATPLVATVGPDITDFASPTPMSMDSPEEINYVTRPEFPEVNEPTVLKNRIGTGANDEAVILIPTPSSGSFSGLSVQVFTTTGRLVKTFRAAEIETIASGRKIVWDGTNDRADDLGPGLYFVQVRVAGRKSVLKVMIVR